MRDDVHAIHPDQVRDLAPDVLDEQGRLRLLPAEYWAATTWQERALFGHRHGIYGLPTIELVEHLRAIIGDRRAIEIGAGHGGLADALGIPATDSRQQEDPRYRRMVIHEGHGQQPVRYGDNVETYEASAAVAHYRPDVVIACWVTHRYERARPWAGGNEAGPDEGHIIDNCAEYVLIGHQRVHRHKRIWDRPHTIECPPYVFSRAGAGAGRDFIATWPGGRQ